MRVRCPHLVTLPVGPEPCAPGLRVRNPRRLTGLWSPVHAALLLLALPAITFAQDGRWRVTGALGYAHITEDEGFLGAGVGMSGGLEFALTDATTIGVEGGLMRHVRDLGFHAIAFDTDGQLLPLPFTERWEGTARFVMATVAHAFGRSSVRPLLWAGGGLMSHGGTSSRRLTMPQVPPGYTLQNDDGFTRSGLNVAAFTFEGGGGVDVSVRSRVTLRPFAGLRLVSAGNSGPKYIIHAGGRVAVSW